MTHQILCAFERPHDQVLELRYEDGRFETRLLEVLSRVESLSEDDARTVYETAKQVGGCICASFPRERKGKVA